MPVRLSCAAPYRILLVVASSIVCATFASAARAASEPDREGLKHFEAKIRPILVEKCYSCHSAEAKALRGGLLLDTKEGLLIGGDSGPAIVVGKPEESSLIQALKFESFEMPPSGQLPESVIADFEHWIKIGAPDPRVGDLNRVYREIDALVCDGNRARPAQHRAVQLGDREVLVRTEPIASEADVGAVAVTHELSAVRAIIAAGTQRMLGNGALIALCMAGVALGRALAASTGAALDRAGRVVVEPDLSLAGFPQIAVIGDLAAAKSHGKGEPKPVPGVSPGAKQMGRAAAANLLRRLRGEPTRPFRYIDYGNLATVGRRAAVVDLAVPVFGAIRFSGFAAWLFWLLAHIYFLIGFRNRLFVMIDWAWAYWTYERHARVVAEPPPAPNVTSKQPAS